jgi:hypothetical protein
MKRGWMGFAVVFVVSWQTGVDYQPQPCVGKEPENVICAKAIPKRTEKAFKSKDAASAFLAVMEEMKATEARLTERKK